VTGPLPGYPAGAALGGGYAAAATGVGGTLAVAA
jgi:hypothetical protein